jgi:hypothetical protein
MVVVLHLLLFMSYTYMVTEYCLKAGLVKLNVYLSFFVYIFFR